MTDLHVAAGSPPQTTLRGRLASLRGFGAIEKYGNGKRSGVEYALTELGLELLFVAEVLEAWLAHAPQGPIALGSEEGKEAVKALGCGWEAAVLRALGLRPCALTELDRVIDGVSYPALERRMAAMRKAGQVETVPGRRPRILYTLTDWTRRGIAPLATAARCERRHQLAGAEPVTPVDVEATFLLAMPLVRLPAATTTAATTTTTTTTGSCLLAVHTGGPARDGRNDGPNVCGACVLAEGGRVVRCDPELRPGPSTWAFGTVEMWLDAVIDGRCDAIRAGGADPNLGHSLVGSIHTALFG